MVQTVKIITKSRTEFVDITSEVRNAVKGSGAQNGICCVYVPHTTAGVTINEGADPSVAKDIQKAFTRLVPQNGGYSHMEGNSDAHIKTTMAGTSQAIIIDKGKLLLGTWQAVFFCEFDGPRSRQVLVKVISN